MELSKEQQDEFEQTIIEVANIAGIPINSIITDQETCDSDTSDNIDDDHILYKKHQIPVLSYISEKLPQHLSNVLDTFDDHHDHTSMLVYAESLDRVDLKTLSKDILSKLRRYSEDYQAVLYLYTVGGGTHDVYNVDTELLTRDDPASIIDIPVLNNQPLSADNYINVISDMRDIVYKRYYKYIEDNLEFFRTQ